MPDGAPKTFSGYTRHAEEQIVGRDGGLGVRREALENAFQHPVHGVDRVVDAHGRLSYRYHGDDATVVMNSKGEVITGWAKNSTNTGASGG